MQLASSSWTTMRLHIQPRSRRTSRSSISFYLWIGLHHPLISILLRISGAFSKIDLELAIPFQETEVKSDRQSLKNEIILQWERFKNMSMLCLNEFWRLLTILEAILW